jgi:hypothetical protein
LAEDSLTQVQSLGLRLEAVGVLVYPRDAERSCHRPGVQHQALPPQLLLPTICASHATRVLCGIDGRHGAGEHSRGAQRCRERDRGLLRIEHASRHFRQQREVQHVVGGVDENDLQLARELAIERPRSVEPGEPSCHHHDARAPRAAAKPCCSGASCHHR